MLSSFEETSRLLDDKGVSLGINTIRRIAQRYADRAKIAQRIEQFCQDFGDTKIEQVTPDDVLSFLNDFTNGKKPYTKRVRYSHLSAFFNFFRNNIDPTLVNPCDTPMIRKL